MLLWAASGKGKTLLASSLHRLTMKYNQKPTLIIAVESGEGGGAATLRKLNQPLFVPKSMEEVDKCLTALAMDKQFGGIVVDSAKELVQQFIKPKALAFPGRDTGPVQSQLRLVGVPGRSDYQVMGELTRQVFNKLLNISSNPNPELKKHIIVTATDKQSYDSTGLILKFDGPDLPGAMAQTAAAMFQISATIDIRGEMVNGKRESVRYLVTETDGPKALKDRFNVFPKTGTRLKLNDEDTLGLDLCDIWERFWLPQMPKAGA